jgi:hypothetical protein
MPMGTVAAGTLQKQKAQIRSVIAVPMVPKQIFSVCVSAF